MLKKEKTNYCQLDIPALEKVIYLKKIKQDYLASNIFNLLLIGFLVPVLTTIISFIHPDKDFFVLSFCLMVVMIPVLYVARFDDDDLIITNVGKGKEMQEKRFYINAIFLLDKVIDRNLLLIKIIFISYFLLISLFLLYKSKVFS